MSQAQATARSSNARSSTALPEHKLTLQETLRIMDVARELRDQRQTAEQMFRRDDARTALRDKLMRTARMSGDDVTEAEIDAAIDQYMANRHTYSDPASGWSSFWAHCWVWRHRILYSALGLAAAGAAAAFTFL